MQISKLNSFNAAPATGFAASKQTKPSAPKFNFNSGLAADSVSFGSSKEKRDALKAAERNTQMAQQLGDEYGPKAKLSDVISFEEEKAAAIMDVVKKGDNALEKIFELYPSNVTLGKLEQDAADFNIIAASDKLADAAAYAKAADLLSMSNPADTRLFEIGNNFDNIIRSGQKDCALELLKSEGAIKAYGILKDSGKFEPAMTLDAIYTKIHDMQQIFTLEHKEAVRDFMGIVNKNMRTSYITNGARDAKNVVLSDASKAIGTVEEKALVHGQKADWVRDAIDELNAGKHPKTEYTLKDAVKLYQKIEDQKRSDVQP